MNDLVLPLSALLLVGVVTYATRAGGLILMKRVTLGPRAVRFLDAMSGSVLVSMILPAVDDADFAVGTGLLAALVIGAGLRRPTLAVFAAVLIVALMRWIAATP